MSDHDDQLIKITLEMTRRQIRNCLILDQYWNDEWQEILVTYLEADSYNQTLNTLLSISPFLISRITPTHEQCMIAIQSDVYALFYIENQTYELCKEAVKIDGRAYAYIKPEHKTKELYELATHHPTNPFY
jgi:hypothetical protein